MSVNYGAKVMVMTTKVCRNMAWCVASSSSLLSEDKIDDTEKEMICDDNDLANLSVVI